MDSFERAGLRFPVADSGGGGEAVVLLHGFPQQPSSFDRMLPALDEAGLRTLAPTQRGYAATCRPLRRRDYRAEETADDVLALLDAAGLDRAHLVGHDWGGGQAWYAAGRHPDRIASLTVLSTPHPAAMRRALLRSAQALRSWYMAAFQLPALPEHLAARTLTGTLERSGLPAQDVTAYAAAMREPGALTGAVNWYRGLPFTGPLGPVRVPTTYAWGRHDFALGRAAAEETERYVTGPYRFAELDEGHWLPEAAPTAVAGLVIEQVHAAR